MPATLPIRIAGQIVLGGGVIAYPTEGVYGLGCLPDDEGAVMRILRIKKRSPAMGLILIASSLEQLSDWVDLPDGSETLASDADAPVTWIVPAAGDVPTWIRGEHTTIAVRITRHPVAAALCDAADSPLVSTSANLSGRRPARNPYILRRNFGHLVDYIVPGRCGPAGSASEIRDLETGKTLRAAST